MKIPFTVLVAIIGILLISTFFGKDKIHLFPVPAKLLCSFLLVAISFYLFINTLVDTTCYGYSKWIFFGMIFGFMGDLIMMGVIPLKNYVIWGMLVFGIGHILYIGAFTSILHRISEYSPFLKIIIPVIITGFLIWKFCVYTPVMPGMMKYGSLVYGVLLTLMAGYALLLFGLRSEFLLAAIGAVLFAISDIILGNTLFRGDLFAGIRGYSFIANILGQWGMVMSVMTIGCK